MSHVIPLPVIQTLKSNRCNSNVLWAHRKLTKGNYVRIFGEWGCAQVVDGLFMRLLSRPLGAVRIRWGICRRGWCACGCSAGVRRRVGWPCFVAGRSRGVACAALLRAGRSRRWGRVDVPPILGQGGGGVHCSGRCRTRPWWVFGVRVGWFWGDLSDVFGHSPRHIETKWIK